MTAPEKPTLLTTVVSGLKDTHKNWWECDTGIAYLVSDGRPERWRTKRMTKIYDLSDPANPKFIRNFALVGQEPGSTMEKRAGRYARADRARQSRLLRLRHAARRRRADHRPRQAAERATPLPRTRLHRPRRICFIRRSAASTCIRRWARIRRFRCSAWNRRPLTSSMTKGPGNRSGKPPKRDFLVVVSESTQNECQEDYHMMYIVDITDETKPYGVSNFYVPEKSGNFCERGGRFGTHSSNEDMGPIYYKRMVFIAWFNAGVRAVDVRDPYSPREVAYYIPAINKNTVRRCIKVERRRPLQDRNPDQQRRGRRSRLHLHRRSRQYRHAHPRADGRGAQGGEVANGRGPPGGPLSLPVVAALAVGGNARGRRCLTRRWPSPIARQLRRRPHLARRTHFLNAVSNVPFLLVGAWGLHFLDVRRLVKDCIRRPDGKNGLTHSVSSVSRSPPSGRPTTTSRPMAHGSSGIACQ